MAVAIPERAQAIIDRLGAVDKANTHLDRGRVEAAIAKHLEALGQSARPVRWIGDAETAYLDVIKIAGAALDSYVGIWLPFVDAFEAGLWLFWVRKEEVIAVPSPALHIVDGRLHRADGPAVAWPNGKRYWFWRGVQVPQAWVEQPESVHPSLALAERNSELRRCLYEILGYERILKEIGAETAQRDDFGELLVSNALGDDGRKPAKFVRVKCPSTGRVYVNRVDPRVTSAREAVASRWRLKPEQYELLRES
jgi:hypothetical protein